MKFASVVFSALALFVATVDAQGIFINYPPTNATIRRGKHLTLQVVRPDYIQSTVEVAVAIGVTSCPNNNCLAPQTQLGAVLYRGPYNPKPPSSGPGQWYQNFTVTVPTNFPTGKALAVVDRFFLVGAENLPELGDATLQVNVV